METGNWLNGAISWQRLVFGAAIILVAGCGSDTYPGPTSGCGDADNWLVADLVVAAETRTAPEEAETGQLHLLALKAILESPNGGAQATSGVSLRWSLFQNAQALSCPPPVTRDEISWIQITSNNDFDPDYLAGQPLEDIALITLHYSDPNSYEPLTGPDARDSWPLEKSSHSVQYYLLFDRQPTLDTEHTFNLQIMLASGAYFEATSAPLNFAQTPAAQ